MPAEIPSLSLTHGQVARALAQGQDPPTKLLDQITYLRRLGIPFSNAEQGKGRGNAIRYSFDHLIEMGIAVFALRHRVRPKDIASILVGSRKELRALYWKAYSEIPSTAFQADWIFSQGKKKVLIDQEIYLALHDRQSAKPGTFELMAPNIAAENFFEMFGEIVMRYADGTTAPAVQLKRLVTELVGLAANAPMTRPGRK